MLAAFKFQALKLRKIMLNAANTYLFGIKCKYIDRPFQYRCSLLKFT